jgi:hypothetical protein
VYEGRHTNRRKTLVDIRLPCPLICKARIFTLIAWSEGKTRTAVCCCSQEKLPVGHNIIYRAFSFMTALTCILNIISLNSSLFFFQKKLYVKISWKIKIFLLLFYQDYILKKWAFFSSVQELRVHVCSRKAVLLLAQPAELHAVLNIQSLTVIPRLTKIIRSGITFVSRNLR